MKRFKNLYSFDINRGGGLKMQEIQILKMLEVSDSNLEWFKNHLDYLKEKFDQNYVAIEDSEVIAFDKSMDHLIQKLKQLNKDPSKLFIQFVSKIKAVL